MLITQMNSSITDSIKNISEYSFRAGFRSPEFVSTDIRILWTLIDKIMSSHSCNINILFTPFLMMMQLVH